MSDSIDITEKIVFHCAIIEVKEKYVKVEFWAQADGIRLSSDSTSEIDDQILLMEGDRYSLTLNVVK